MAPETLELLERIFQRSLSDDGKSLTDINNWSCRALMDEQVRVALQRYEGRPQDVPNSLKILARAA